MAVGVAGGASVEQSDGAEPSVEVEPGKSAGFARMIAFLLEPAVRKDPRAAARIRGSLALKVTDQNAGVTIEFDRGRVKVTGAMDPDASVIIEAPLLTLGALGEGGHAIRDLIRREIRVKRGLRHLQLLIRVRRLLLKS